MSNRFKQDTVDRLHFMRYIHSQSDADTNTEYEFHKGSLNKFKKFHDNELLPLRLEQATLYANLQSDQADLTIKNDTLVQHQKAQLKVIDRIVSDFYNKGFVSMREYQSIDYNIHKKKLMMRIINVTFALVSFIAVVAGFNMNGMLNQKMATGMVSVASISYIVFLLMNYRQNLYRNKYDWNKLYWNSPK